MTTTPINKIKSNPNNPRVIKDDKFKKLVQSLKDLPEMAQVRPIVVNQDMIVLGGNMRLKAMKEAGWKEAPVAIVDWDEDKQRQFIIKDNVGFGEWDWDMLANEWNAESLGEWALNVPNYAAGVIENEMTEDELDLTEEFDPIGQASGLQRVVFIFDGAEEAESWLSQHPSLPLKKMNMAWQIDLSTQSILSQKEDTK
jgi:ParB-like chromosome segregation protein Spo0J